MVPRQNCSAVCVTTMCFVTVAVEEAEAGVADSVPGVGMPYLDRELDADRVCGGGVGRALGTPEGEPSVMGVALIGFGEKGGVDASGCVAWEAAEPSGRGVECRESWSAEAGESKARGSPLRGVVLLICVLRDSVFAPGTMISVIEIPWAARSMELRVLRVRLSARRWTMVLSWRTARARARPAEGVAAVGPMSSLVFCELLTLAVSSVSAGVPLPSAFGCASWSTQFAGVGGTGPNAATPVGGGRLVGGETTGVTVSLALLTLCDLD